MVDAGRGGQRHGVERRAMPRCPGASCSRAAMPQRQQVVDHQVHGHPRRARPRLRLRRQEPRSCPWRTGATTSKPSTAAAGSPNSTWDRRPGVVPRTPAPASQRASPTGRRRMPKNIELTLQAVEGEGRSLTLGASEATGVTRGERRSDPRPSRSGRWWRHARHSWRSASL